MRTRGSTDRILPIAAVPGEGTTRLAAGAVGSAPADAAALAPPVASGPCRPARTDPWRPPAAPGEALSPAAPGEALSPAAPGEALSPAAPGEALSPATTGDPRDPVATAPARRRARVVVVDSPERHTPDRLDHEFEVVMRLSVPQAVERIDTVLRLCQPKLMLVKLPLDDVDPRLLASCLAARVNLLVLARPTYGLLRPARLRRLGGLVWVPVRWPAGPPACGRLKRALDLGIVLLALPVLLPVMLVIAALTCWDGPPLYFQQRMGERGRLFRIVKFRTMRVDAERDTGPRFAVPGDLRVTRIGALLRRTRLDELPQVWNVLRGEMSLVGPRPERPAFVAEFQRLQHYELRHLIRPGLTGIAQLTGGYAASAEEKLRFDLLYLSYRSLRLDLNLLVLTALDMLRGFPRG
ncbi:sugar transferase [Plantactinospora siamensis]|uniref:Sugar transferase n=1 Tax=Plantactinospora siamensis TaxID=555372 RepID=A0ABV6P435_9ACTN